MKLLTKEILAKLPPMATQRDVADPIAYVKFFTPDANWTWYAIEGEVIDGDDFIFFGYVIGHFSEWGTFTLSQLESVRGGLRLPVERDLGFRPTPFSKIQR